MYIAEQVIIKSFLYKDIYIYIYIYIKVRFNF